MSRNFHALSYSFVHIKTDMLPKAKLTKDKETENEPATDGVAEPGGISAILDLLRIIQKDMDELKEENRIIKSQLVSHQEPIKLTEIQQL